MSIVRVQYQLEAALSTALNADGDCCWLPVGPCFDTEPEAARHVRCLRWGRVVKDYRFRVAKFTTEKTFFYLKDSDIRTKRPSDLKK